MRYLFRYLNGIKSILADKPLFLFLDYDGTVTPIRQKPSLGLISKRAKNLLCKLSENSSCRVVVISGRSLKDVRRLVGLDNVIYGGNHGLELAGPQVRFRPPVSEKNKEILKKINCDLHNKLRRLKGALIENKGLSLSVHYRLVKPKNIGLVKTIFSQATERYLSRNEIQIRPGKKVLEVFPPVDWGKGRAVKWLLQNQNNARATPIYIGDDVSDEEAFKLLKDSGLTIFVGKPKKSNARYYVTGPREVLKFLAFLLKTS
jgi:trehalose 6-phosphate phosphatase